MEDLLAAPVVIGFNHRRFDLEVLRPYTPLDLTAVKCVDMLDVLKARLGFRVTLASLAEANFGEAKLADGVQSVQWFREGRFDLIETYCRKDVELTGRLYQKGLDGGLRALPTARPASCSGSRSTAGRGDERERLEKEFTTEHTESTEKELGNGKNIGT